MVMRRGNAGFTVVCNTCGNRNVTKTGYRGGIVAEEIDVEVVENLSGWVPEVEYVVIECFKCRNSIEL